MMKGENKDQSSSIVNWDLHHKMNKTFEKTLEEIINLLDQGKLHLGQMEEYVTAKHKKQKNKNSRTLKKKPEKDKT